MRSRIGGWWTCRAAMATALLAVAGPALAAREAKEMPEAGAATESEGDFAAQRLLRRAQDLLLAQETERGVRMIETVVEQYPSSDVRFQAFLALGKHYMDTAHDPNQAVTYFGQVKALERRETLGAELKDMLVESLYLTGVCYFKMRDYAKAFPALRKITTDYPNTVWANQAYYYIGMCHFVQERWNQAIDALSLVGTYVDPEAGSADLVEAGRRLFIKVQDGDLPVLYDLGNKVVIKVKAASGDEDTVECVPLSGSRNVFIGSIPTRPGAAVPADGTLQVIGGDKIEVTYTDVNTQDGEKDVGRLTKAKVVSSAGLVFTLGDYQSRAKHGFLGQPVFLVLDDVDLDLTPGADTAAVKVMSRYRVERDEESEQPIKASGGFAEFLEEKKEEYRIRDEVTVTLNEVGTNAAVRTGHFGGTFTTVPYVAGQPIDKTDAALAAAEGDEIVASYVDRLHADGEFDREVTSRVVLGGAIDTSPQASQNIVTDEMIKARKNLVEAQAYLELGTIFKDMGLMEGAAEKAEEGLERVDRNIRTQAAIDPALREQAFKLKWELHLVKNDYDAAIATCQAFNKLFPTSAFVDQALLGIGQIKMANKAYPEAINVYQQILALENSMAKAEAQFRIAEATELAAAERGTGAEQAIGFYKACADRYPDSAFAGPSLGKLIDYQIETKDYAQATDLLRQVFQDYPDAEFLDAMLLKWVMVAFRTGDFKTALAKCDELIFQYPGSKYAAKAKEVKPTIEERL